MCICREYVGSKPQAVVPIICEIEEEVAMWFMGRVHVSVIQTNTIFGMQLIGQLHEVLLISDVFQCHYIMGI